MNPQIIEDIYHNSKKSCCACIEFDEPNSNYDNYSEKSVMLCRRDGENYEDIIQCGLFAENYDIVQTPKQEEKYMKGNLVNSLRIEMLKYVDTKCDELAAELKTQKKPLRWRAKEGEDYYFVDPEGITILSTEQDCKIDDFRYLTGNYKKTKLGIKNYYRALQIQGELEELADYIKPWPKDRHIYYLVYNTKSEKYRHEVNGTDESAMYGFKSSTCAFEALQKLGQESLLCIRHEGLSV